MKMTRRQAQVMARKSAPRSRRDSSIPVLALMRQDGAAMKGKIKRSHALHTIQRSQDGKRSGWAMPISGGHTPTMVDIRWSVGGR